MLAAVAGKSEGIFVYGSLRRGELAHRQIAPFVAAVEPAEVTEHRLDVRDGLPFMIQSPGWTVEGDLLSAVPGQAGELLDRIRSYEGTALYSECNVSVRTQGGATAEALAFVGRHADRGHPVPLDRPWSSAEDPVFRAGLDEIACLTRHHLENVRPVPADMDGFWAVFLPLQGLYLTLCTVLERYTALTFGHRLDVAERLKRLRAHPAACCAAEDASPPEITVVDSRDPTKRLRVPGPRSFDAWYGVRSNLSHRGKAAYTDFELVERSVVGLHDTLRLLLACELPFSDTDRQAYLSERLILLPVYRQTRP